MKAIWNNHVIAEAAKKDLIYIEGNWYFPASAVNQDYISASNTHTHCYWKGRASYCNINVDGNENNDGAWYYPKPSKLSLKIVKNDFTGYVAFWHGVQVTE